MGDAARMLHSALAAIEANDTNYPARYGLVLRALDLAVQAGLSAGLGVDPKQPDWPIVVYIELPTGQVSWHMRQHLVEWDGHDTVEKYRRCREFALQEVPSVGA
jgi:hypothetical protein